MRHSAFLGLALGALSSLGLFGGGQAINIMAPERMAIMPQMPVISKTSKRKRKTTSFKANGKREVARRLRQIAAGQLTRSNGLVTAEELYGMRKAA